MSNMEENIKNIIAKVSELYHQYGIKSVTMDDVSRHLGISKKTLYFYVKDKKELVEMTIETQLQRHKKMEKELCEQNLGALEEMHIVYGVARELMRKMNPSYQYDLKKYYPMLCDRLSSFRKDHLYNKVKDNLLKGKREGIYRADIDEEVISRMLASQNNAMTNMKSEDIMFFSSKETFEELFKYHIHAILNDKGRELLKQRNFFQNS